VSLRAAILGFLELEPTTGYTLKQRFEGSVGSFWSVTQSQIYRELHALEREGFVSVRIERGEGKPDRKVYGATASGREVLHRWLREPLEPLQLRHPLLLKFVFPSEVEPAALDAVLASYEAGVEATAADYRDRLRAEEIFALARSPREAEIWRLSIEHGLAWCEAEAAWLARAREKLRNSKVQPARRRRAKEKS
jgi:DNA-binding PadR family transcriptional regulator